jgi:alpha-tubulin suppressor-like RCC1 family protein
MLAVAGCYEQPSVTCKIECTPSVADSCPDGMQCNEAGLCNVGGASCTGPSVDWRAIGVGARHVCGLSMTGEVYCWGDNSLGQIGTGMMGDPIPRVTLVNGGPYNTLAVGSEHTCALDGDGKPWCWGQNAYGQARGAGPGTSLTPIDTTLPANAPSFDQLAAGGRQTCAIGNGELWCWGHRTFTNGTAASQATHVAATINDWTSISCGKDHCCGLSTSMGALCFGENSQGQLGNATTAASSTPVPAGLPAGMTPIFLVAGHQYSCAIVGAAGATAGELWCWGRNTNGTHIIDTGNSDKLSPTRMGSDADWTSLSPAHHYACGQRGRQVYCWGDSYAGGYGDGIWGHFNVTLANAVNVGEADEVVLHPGAPEVNDDVEIGCRRTGTEVDCFGDDSYGQLARGTTTRRGTPVEVTPPGGHTWSRVVAGHQHTCAILDDKTLYCWGMTDDGEANAGMAVGNDAPCNDRDPCDIAEPLAMPAPIDHVDDVTAGDHFSCARIGAVVRCWGLDYRGYIGPFQPEVTRTLPGPGGAGWTTLFGGDQATCGITTANQLACWGYVPYNMMTSTPTNLTGLDNIIAVTFGSNFGCVLDAFKQRICWGENNRGQLGVGNQSSLNFSQRISDVEILSVSTFADHTCTVKSSGLLQCFGSNDYRESGAMDTSQNYSVPVTVKKTNSVDLTMCTQTSVGTDFSCAVCGGRVYCFGYNGTAQLGRGVVYTEDPTEIADEVKLPVDERFTTVVTGNNHACALAETGKIYCWGDSMHGQIGDGTQSRNLPTPVGR